VGQADRGAGSAVLEEPALPGEPARRELLARQWDHTGGVTTDEPDARAVALATYLRERAAALSLSADVSDSDVTARAGMALLDAAQIAASMPPHDIRLTALSEAGLFETMPESRAVFLETQEVHAVVYRAVAGGAQSGAAVIELIVATARRKA
jgi:hypothetical protein